MLYSSPKSHHEVKIIVNVDMVVVVVVVVVVVMVPPYGGYGGGGGADCGKWLETTGR